MNPNTKKALNLVSYIFNGIFLLLLVLAVNKTRRQLSQEEDLPRIKQCIVDRERAELPLKIQQFERVYGITIDSLVITKYDKPYAGYLVTTWEMDEKQKLSLDQYAANGYQDKYIRKNKTVYVEVERILGTSRAKLYWDADWSSAYYSTRKEN